MLDIEPCGIYTIHDRAAVAESLAPFDFGRGSVDVFGHNDFYFSTFELLSKPISRSLC